MPDNAVVKLWNNHPFHVHIATVFIVLVLAIQISLALYTRHETRRMLAESVENLLDHVQREAVLDVQSLRSPIELMVEVTARLAPLMQARTFEERFARVAMLAAPFQSNPQISAVYVGYDNGEFFLVRPVPDEAARKRFGTPEDARYLVQSVESGGAKTRWVALSGSLKPIREWSPPDYRFDPRERDWYQQANRTNQLVRTDPYAFATTGTIGSTVAMRSEDGHAVAGVDMHTRSLSESLRRSRLTESAELAVFDAQGDVLAYSDPSKVTTRNAAGGFSLAKLKDLSPLMAAVSGDLAGFASSRVIELDGRDWSVKVSPLLTNANRDLLVVAAPVDELEADVTAIQRRLILIQTIVVLLGVPIIYFVAQRIANQLGVLTAQASAIRRFDFKTEIPLMTHVREIFGLGRAMNQMKTTIQKFLDVSIALAAERSFDALMSRVLREVGEAADGDCGVIYLYEDDKELLRYSSQWWAGGATLAPTLPDLSFGDDSHPVAAGAKRLTATSVHTIGHPRPEGLDYLNSRYGDTPVEMIVIPLLGRTGRLVGVLCNYLGPGTPLPSKERMALVEAFAGAAAVSIDQQRLLQAEKTLLNSFIGLIAAAIDAKSPYTGGHCQRVPELTEMLARAAHDAEEGPFAGFTLNEDEWEELRIASWLHDCGKVTTPEFVVDKATKLETMYDRIHEVRMRFEVLKRDAEIAALKEIAAGGDAGTIQARLAEDLASVDDDFAFVAACNEGGEFMSPDKVERLKRIAARTWRRTLDDRLGVSWEERKRKDREPAAPLPATERLLADKAEHVIERGPDDVMADDNRWGFKLKVPRHLYNRGELYNLAVGRGTLAEEERYKINDHIVQTIVMLSNLPFPRHLRNVPEIAGGHHEKMDGTGYPKRLRREEMSLPARIMAIADIFEALTAADRPYKKGKKLSEAIRIMANMAKDHHVDPDLFELFLESGIYRRYAEKYLAPELIDEVDITAYLRKRDAVSTA